MERRGIQTERGEMRREAQQEHAERRSLVNKARETFAAMFQAAKAAIARVVTHRQAAEPSDPHAAWLRKNYPNVLEMSPQQAQHWIQDRLAENTVNATDRERPTAWELFLSDYENPKSNDWRLAEHMFRSAEQMISGTERGLEYALSQSSLKDRLADKMGLPRKHIAAMYDMLAEAHDSREKARLILKPIQDEWQSGGLGRQYEARAAAEAERRDTVIAQKTANRQAWTDFEPMLMKIVNGRWRERRQASAAIKRQRDPQQRQRDRNLEQER